MSDQLANIMKRQQNQVKSSLLHDEKKEEEIIQLVGFTVGDEEYAVPILSIQEIIKPIDYTRVPKTPKFILGVFNLRGNVIPLIDLRKKFNIKSQEIDENTRYIVIKDGENVAGFVIDKITEAIRLNKKQIDPTPETLKKEKSIIEGIGKRENSIITILKVDELLKRDF